MVDRFPARALSVCLMLFVAAIARPAGAASRYDPALRFRAFATPHFFIYFHQGEDALARRFAPIAEDVHRDLTARLGTRPAGRTHVILVDQNDVSNGWATPLPYDTIEITVAPPATRSLIGNTDDWLRLVFIHEYTHILQLDRSRGYASVLRHLFGRAPISFPNLSLPGWQIEGLATYEESARTGRGRLNAGDFALLVDYPARRGLAWPLDRASGDLDDWPGGNTPYAYGGFFHAYLADRFGEARLGELAARTAGQFYFLSSPAFKQVFGRSLGDLWDDFERARREGASRSPRPGRRLTRRGFVVAGPRFVQSAPGRLEIVYSSSDADDFPSLSAVDLDGGTHRIASRYSGEQIGVSGPAGVFDDVDLYRSVALRSDLYHVDFVSGHVERLTRNRRLQDPTVSAGGHGLACVALREGERHLALFDLPAGAWPRDVARLRAALRGAPRLELADPGIEYASPRWSPDGRLVAVSRQVRDGPSQIAVVNAATGSVTVLVSTRRARNVTPAWTPDGRTIVFASDRRGPFNLYAVDLGQGMGAATPPPVYELTDFTAGARDPDVSPDGQQLAYVGYDAEPTRAGYDLFLLPFERETWREVAPQEGGETPVSSVQAALPAAEPRPAGPGPYRPWGTLLPRYWIPAFDVSDRQWKLGGETSGSDVLGRHVWAATVLFRVAGQSGAPGSPRFDWAAGYTYDRFVPSLFVDASDRTHYLRQELSSDGRAVPADVRDQSGEAGVFLPRLRVRYQQAVTASLNVQRQTLNVGGLGGAQSDRNAVRLAWLLNSAKVYAYSISPEQGATVGVTGEMVRHALGADGDANAATLDGRAYLRLGGRHRILALRVAGGAASGDPRTERIFYLGGPGPNANPTDFGSDAFNLLRGFGQNEFAGTRMVAANLEYRVPLVRVERGIGTWPVFLRTLHATAFLDAGKVWVPSFSRQPLARSAGMEIAADIRLVYGLPLTAAAGVAWPRDPAGFGRPAVFYARLGHAF